MRPELNQRFCGRCGEPCAGYEEPAAGIDPPQICARCAIERHRGNRTWAQLLVVATGVSFVALGQVVIEGLWLSRLWFPSAPRIGTPARWLYLVPITALVWALICALRVARREAAQLREIRQLTESRPTPDAEGVAWQASTPAPARRPVWTARLLGLAAVVTFGLFCRISLEAPAAFRLATIPRDWANAVHFGVLLFATGMSATVLTAAWQMTRRDHAA